MSSGAQIVRFFPFTPTKQQQVFCEKMASFLNQTDVDKCFVLKGYAGTGKTTSIAALVQALPLFKLKAVLLAPTGRAAKVMGAYSVARASTIHKKIYRKKSSIATSLAFSIAPNLSQNTVFIVDESSMIADEYNHQRGSSFLKDLIEYVYQLSPDGKNKNCCLLFVGDTAQLPPVGSLESPALNEKYLAQNFTLNITQVELTEVVRQKNKSGILANATALRQLINSAKANALPKFITKNYTDIFRMTGERLVEGLEYAYRKFGIENTLVVCRANKSANQYNQYIRSQLLYREETLTGGDQIMVVKNNYFWLP
ncbi:MAG: AAA family ATPase, partial [Sphingobacteriaceae bacterium]|nr:AAA family ATPase [Sphingobacteriaceae bacterium]